MRARWSSLVVLVALIATWAVPCEPVLAAQVSVDDESVEAVFPSGITFTVDIAGDAPITTAAVLFTIAGQSSAREVAAVRSPSDDTVATAQIDMTIDFVPAGVDLSYQWRLETTAGDVTTEPEAVAWQDDRFAWERSASEDVEVFGYAGGAELRGEVLTSAQETVNRLTAEFGVTVGLPLRIWVYDSKRDFDGTMASNSQEWAAGAAYPDLKLILAVIPENRPSELGRIIPHEVSHQILAIATANPYNAPATWFDEGLAVVNQTNGNGQMDRLVAEASRDGDLLPLTALNNGFPYDPDEASLSYAQGYSAVRYLTATYGPVALGSIAEAYRAGNTHDDVFLAAIGRDVAQLDVEWRASIDETALGTPGGEGLARVLIYGVPAVGVVVYLVLRRLRHPEPRFPDEDDELAVPA